MAREVRLSMRVWDTPTRLFHWAIVILVILAYVAWRLDWRETHFFAGYAVLALLIFRALWGFVGSETSRFRRFVASPSAVLHDLAHGPGSRGPDNRVGYGAAGGWMVLLLLVVLTAEAATGLFARGTLLQQGPLAAVAGQEASVRLSAWHLWLAEALLAVIALHLLAVLAGSVFRRHDLIRPMITGRKRLPGRTRPPRMASSLLAFAVLVVAIVLTWIVVWLVPRVA